MESSGTNQVKGRFRAVAGRDPTRPNSSDPSRTFSIEKYVRQSTDASDVPLRVQDVRILTDIATMLALRPPTQVRNGPTDIAS